MNATRYVEPLPVPERVGWQYDGDLKDEAGVPIPLAAWVSLTIKIHVLNAALTDIVATATNILNTGRGTLHATSGHIAILFLPTDSAIVDPLSEVSIAPRDVVAGERHLATIEGVYSGARQFAREIEWAVVNMAKRT